MSGVGAVVRDLNEDELVARLVARIREKAGSGPGEGELWSGDDAAVVASRAGRVVVTTDTVTEGIDFDLAYTPPASIGWKALAVNVSDVAAMGATPAHAVATLLLPPATALEVADGIADGLGRAAARWGVSVVGGDLGRASEISVGVALHGWAPDRVVRRDGARPGDALFVTGTLGGAGAALAATRSGDVASDDARLGRLLWPEARVEEGAAARAAGATAMIDVSDGLAVDLWRLTTASGVGCVVEVDRLPVDDGLESRDGAVRHAVLGGDDYELLFTISEANVSAELLELGAGATRIGTITEGAATLGDRSLESWKEEGWDHLRDR